MSLRYPNSGVNAAYYNPVACLPGAPTIGTATATGTSVSLTFTAPGANGGNPITCYIATSNVGGFTGANTSSPVTISGLTKNTGYSFTVAARTATGTGASSSASNGILAIGVPNAPTIGTATAVTYCSATVAFTAPTCNGGASIDTYQAISTPGCITATGSSSPISVTGLSATTSYTFKVRAHNSQGYSSYSSSSNSITTPVAATYMSITTTGACVSTCGSYKIARFYGAGSFSVTTGFNVGNYGNHINYVAVAGGGTGGNNQPGGGAGGVLNCCTSLASGGFTVTNGTYTVSVGAGGTNPGTVPTCSVVHGHNTTVSKCGTVICAVGGGPGRCSYHSISGYGGSGGGGVATCGGSPQSGASGISGQGNNGGTGYIHCYSCSFASGGGGGGGAGAAGSAGNGGAGRAISFIGSTLGGGGGGGAFGYCTSASPGSGGSGGGGNGGYSQYCYPSRTYPVCYSGTAGSSYTGGGGGSSGRCKCNYQSGKNGGSGFFAIKWRFQA